MKNHYVIVSGSHRKTSQSAKVARYLTEQLTLLDPANSAEIIDLADNPLPLWEESIWDDDPNWEKRLQPYRESLVKADGVIIISPEWGGMVPPGLKNFFLLFGPRELGHKPALIVSVSAARGGAYPVSELRMSGYKNNRICYIPEHLIIRDVEKVMNTKVPSSPDDEYIQKRSIFALKILIQYTQAFKQIRSFPELFSKEFSNGM